MPIIERTGKWRVLIYALEIKRPHVHVLANDRRAVKVWIVPNVELARNEGLNVRELAEAIRLVKKNREQYLEAWRELHG